MKTLRSDELRHTAEVVDRPRAFTGYRCAACEASEAPIVRMNKQGKLVWPAGAVSNLHLGPCFSEEQQKRSRTFFGAIAAMEREGASAP